MPVESLERKQFLKFFSVLLLATIFVRVYQGITPFSSLHIISQAGNSEYIKIVRDMIQLGGYLITARLLYSGFKWGKRIDIENQYRTFFKAIIGSWFGSILFSAIGWLLVKDDIWKSIFHLMGTQSILGGYSTGMTVFSGVVLGGLWTDKYRFEREWNRPLLKYVLIVTGLRFVSEMVRTYLWKDYFFHHREALTTFSWTTAALFWVFHWWFLFKIFGLGKQVDLIGDYKSILYTLGAPKIVANTITEIFQSVVYERTILRSMIEIGFRIIQTSLGVFGTGFAVICFGYYHYRYSRNGI